MLRIDLPDPLISRQLLCGPWELEVDGRVKIKDLELCFVEFGAVLGVSLEWEKWLGFKNL